jgi:hypothetical protein
MTVRAHRALREMRFSTDTDRNDSSNPGGPAMRRAARWAVAGAGVCLLFVLSAASAQRFADRSVGQAAPARVASTAMMPSTGPGGFGPARRTDTAARFVGLTNRTFTVGVGALAASRACLEEAGGSRLCEWGDIFRALPPIDLQTYVLVARNYDVDPQTTCLTPDGGVRCRPGELLPAACCGDLQPPRFTSLVLTPGDGQSLLDCSDSFEFGALATGPTGDPVSGALVLFEFISDPSASVSGTFTPATGVTDASGMVFTTVSFQAPSCDLLCLGPGRDCTARIRAQDGSGLIVSNEVEIIDAIP